jgi:hypothetical protein
MHESIKGEAALPETGINTGVEAELSLNKDTAVPLVSLDQFALSEGDQGAA